MVDRAASVVRYSLELLLQVFFLFSIQFLVLFGRSPLRESGPASLCQEDDSQGGISQVYALNL